MSQKEFDNCPRCNAVCPINSRGELYCECGFPDFIIEQEDEDRYDDEEDLTEDQKTITI